MAKIRDLTLGLGAYLRVLVPDGSYLIEIKEGDARKA
jgi:hypothetical protein